MPRLVKGGKWMFGWRIVEPICEEILKHSEAQIFTV